MKLAVAGKGGVGKTTLTALLAQTYAERGRDVLAIDTDPAPALAEALAFPAALRAGLHPIAGMAELIEQRTGAKPGTVGGFFTLNPRVDDLPDRFSAQHGGVRLLELGGVPSGGAGCICPQSALLKTLFTHLLFRGDEVLLFDMYAGVEHLGRATVDFVDALLVVTEPTRRSLAAAAQIERLAADVGLTRVWLIGNRVRDDEDVAFLERETPGPALVGWLPEEPGVIAADREGSSVYAAVPPLREAAATIADELEALARSLA